MMLDDDEVKVLSDGTAPGDVDKLMSEPEEIRHAMARAHQDLPVELSINAS